MQLQDDQFLPSQLTCRVWKSSTNLPHDSLTRGNHLSEHRLHIDQGHHLTFREKWPLTTCIWPTCATGPGNANSPLLKYVWDLLGSGPREAKEASGASERGKAGARWKEMGGWCMAKTEQQQGSSWGGMSRVSSPQCQGVNCPRPPGWKELSDASAQMPTSHWTQTSPSPQHPICFPSFQNGTKGSQTKCREKVKEKWISSLPEERLIESKFSQKGNHG